MRNFLVLTVVVLCIQATLLAQPVVLLKGSIVNVVPGTKTDITFKDELGNVVRATSATDGSYQTVLKPGHQYTVVVTDENLTRYTFSYEVPAMTKYTELHQDFTLTPKTPVAEEKPSTTKSKKKTKSKKTTKGKQP